MRRRLVTLILLVLALALIGGAAAFAHECNDPAETDCHTTPVVPDWRGGNYIPLFDIDRDCDRDGTNPDEADCADTGGHDSDGDGDIDGDDQRYDAQRWRDECVQPDGYEANQFCVWADFGTSGFADTTEDPEPNEIHIGSAGSHCFLFEFAHQCEDHYKGGNPSESCEGYPPGECPSEGVHDAHGGSVYADFCFAKNADSKWCDDGMEDTQVAATVMDHNPCGAPVPVVACIDEYHVIRPFDQAYTTEQMDDSAERATEISEDPATYTCGREGFPDYTDGACHDAFDQLGF
jgi:hypothetical protein